MYVANDFQRTLWQFSGHEDIKTWMHNRRGLFPGLHSLLAFAIFGIPVIGGIELGTDSSVLYWIGWHTWFVLVVPLLLVASHLMHVVSGRPQFNAMLLSTVIPALIVICIGYSVTIPIGGITDRLFSSDCTTYSDKTYLDSAYKVAANIWKACVAREVNETGRSVQAVKFSMIVNDCDEYQAVVGNPAEYNKWRVQWRYLRELETRQACSGWCDVGQESLWTTDHEPKDLCSTTVGGILDTAVKRLASRMLVSGLIALVVSLIVLVAVQEYMIRLGVEW
uniref:Uncharacterized protein n=1 Tax=Pyrodinium bahamense TaxID=73915 RepID=A0A7S0F882_9DINO|mmetsp:Transcript_11253/g.30704  ORF Transcript_11253/g.30704 Transcript_11253/m.30704 type:complete len:279 (+) Transcript_11253:76-912(+)